MASNLTAYEIKQVFRRHYHNRFTEVGLFEFDPGMARFDAFMIQPHRRIFKGFEIKVSHSDFLRDKKNARPSWRREYTKDAKWEYYLKYCHLFYYVCPENIIMPDEVESPAGLLWAARNSDGSGGFFLLKKRPKRNGGPDDQLAQKILFLFAARAKTRAGDYF